MEELTQAKLKKHLVYIPETGAFVRLHGRGKGRMTYGSVCDRGYLGLRVDYDKYMAHRLAWLYVYGYMPKNEIDHINGRVNDNRIANLREATRGQNMLNTLVPKNNRSGVKGVHFDKANQKWLAYIQVDKRFINLGRFESIEAAKAARMAAAVAYFGEFAKAENAAKSLLSD